MPMPTRFGHEFSGDVAAAGAGVTACAPATRSCARIPRPCGRCFWCERDEEELCERVMRDEDARRLRRVHRGAGAHRRAQLLSQSRPTCRMRKRHFSSRSSCVVHSIALLAPRAGATVAVIGDGGVRHLHALLLQREGVRADACRPPPRTRGAGARAWASKRSTRTSRTACDELLARTGGRGADAVVECTGSADVWERAPELRAARRTRLVLRRVAGGHARVVRGLAPALRRGSAHRARFISRRATCGAPTICIASHALPLERLISRMYPP